MATPNHHPHFAGQDDSSRSDPILPPPQYERSSPSCSPCDNNLPLPPPLPPRGSPPRKLPPPPYPSDSSRTPTPELLPGESWGRDQPSGKEASLISSGQVTPEGTATGNRRKVKKLVSRQVNIFNDKVQPELRQILAQRISGKEPVEV